MSFSGSKSPSSEMLLFVSTRVVRFGTERCRDCERTDIRLLARRRVRNRLIKGMFPSVIMALSVRSMASCWSCRTLDRKSAVRLPTNPDVQERAID